MNKLFFDKAAFKATIDDTTGFLKAPVILSRTGVQHYLGLELGITGDRATEKIGVLRPAAEVFAADSLDSFVNMIVTDDHPAEMVNINNVKKLQIGQVSDVKKDGSVLSGVITITDKKALKKIKDGKLEVSVGYGNELVKESGTFEGIKYDFIQTQIRGNHLAIVDAGRCGSACKLTLDKKKENAMKITIDGITFEADER